MDQANGLESPEISRRTYADLLALADAAPVWQPPAEPQAAAEQSKKLDTTTESEICRSLHIDVLGRMEDGSVKIFSTFHRRTSLIKMPSRMSYEDFLQHCGPPAKACLLKSRVDDDVPGMWGVDIARAAVQMLAGYRTLSNELELGPGCWRSVVGEQGSSEDEEDEVIIVGPDEAAKYNGHLERIEHPRAGGLLLDFTASGKHWYGFDNLQNLLDRAADHKFRMDVYRDSLELWQRWRWAYQESTPAVITGLVLATWVQQLWSWRPQVAIIGPSKSGKSLMCDALAGIFRNNVILTSDTTAAGLRQEIENSMPAVVVDEGDPKDKSQQAERRKILAMIRQASRGGLTLRGSSNQRSVRHTLQHLFWIFGIQLPFEDEADRNRVIMTELRLPERENEGKLHLPSTDQLADLGQRMLAVALWAIRRARPLALRLRDFRIDGIDSRAVESYAVPAAILSVMHGYDQDDAGTKQLLSEMLAEAKSSDPPIANHDSLIHEILSSKLQVDRERLTVAQLLERVDTRSASGYFEAEQALASCGIKLDFVAYGSKKEIIIQYQPLSKHLLRGTRWDGAAIDQVLRVMPSAIACRRRVGGMNLRGVSIDWEYFSRRYLESPESKLADMKNVF